MRRLRCCALDQTGGVSKVLGCSSQCAPPRICPLLLSGLEERRSSLYLGGRVSSTKYRRQAVHGAVKALLPPLISSVFNITVCFGSMRGRLSKKTPYETNPFIQVVVFFSCFLCVKLLALRLRSLCLFHFNKWSITDTIRVIERFKDLKDD